MKRVIVTLSACALMAIGFSSCLIKNRTCTCTETDKSTGSVSTSSSTVTSSIFTGGKSSAKAECEAQNFDNSYSSYTCTLN